MTDPRDEGSIYELLISELLVDPERVSAGITAGIQELRNSPTTVAMAAIPPVQPVTEQEEDPA